MAYDVLVSAYKIDCSFETPNRDSNQYSENVAYCAFHRNSRYAMYLFLVSLVASTVHQYSSLTDSSCLVVSVFFGLRHASSLMLSR